MYISFRKEACCDVYYVLQQGEDYEISIMKDWVMALVYVGLKWTANRYDDNRFQGFITYVVQGQEIPPALKRQCHRYQFSLLQTQYYVKNKRQSKFCRCFRIAVLLCAFDILMYISKAVCRLIDNTNALARGQSTYNCLELQGVFAILFRFKLYAI